MRPAVDLGRRGGGRHRRVGPVRRTAAVLGRHWPLLALLAAGLVLRLLAQLAYLPAGIYFDSGRYLRAAHTLEASGLSPIGYSLLVVRPLLALGDLTWLPAANHVFGLIAGVLAYAVVWRWGDRRWLAALAAAPVLLDAYVVQIEQMVMSDAFFLALIAASFAVLLWRRPPGPAAGAVTGLLLGTTTTVRLVGAVLVAPALLYLLLAGRGRRVASAALLVVLFALPLLGVAARYRAETGRWGLSPLGPRLIYARTAPLADCALLSEQVRFLCPSGSPTQRLPIDLYVWSAESPAVAYSREVGADAAAPVLRAFGREVIRAQPWDVTSHILRDYLKGFAWARTTAPGDVPVERWHFDDTRFLAFGGAEIGDPAVVAAQAERHGGGPPRMNTTLAALLRRYQLTVGWTPGTLVGLALLAGLAAPLVRRASRQAALAALTLSLAGIAVVLAAVAYEFSWRYQLPALVLAPQSGALAAIVLLGRRRRQPLDDHGVDVAALEDLRAHHGDITLRDLCVVIAAYDEEDAIGDVLDAIPERVCGLAVDRLVIVDGARDATAAVARAHGALVADCPVNRGQGAALRLGYQIARDGGARYIATIDADGQYDPAELEVVVAPLVAGEADFVTGSRRLGRESTSDGFRRLGVRFFAALVSL
ncbi:MAG TPA: glycosyltransferase family 2 protein, partial [Egibacteraceae bacterium]